MKPKSANFDFIGAANSGYRTAWINRSQLIRLAGLPLMIKFGCLAAILFLGFEGQVLRHGLVMLPSYFAEGFFIAYVIRTVHAGADLSADVKQARHYFDDVVAAMIAFVLIQLALAFVVGNTIDAVPMEVPQDAQQPTPPSLESFMMACLALGVMVWAFRFAWFHVPLAMGVSLKAFMERISSFSSSIPMLGCWFICFLPMLFAMMLVSRGVLIAFPQVEGGENLISTLLLYIVQGGFEMLINLIAGISMSYGFKSLMEQK